MGIHPLGLVDHLPGDKEDGKDTNHSVAEEEGWNIPRSGEEDSIATDKSHDEAHDECVVCTVWLPERFVRKGVSADSLCFKSFLEVEISVAHDAEVDQLRCGDLKLSV